MSTLTPIYNHACRSCSLHEHATTVCVEASGNPDFRAMVVGEAPGRSEDANGRPFIGQAGTILNDALAAAFETTSENIRKQIVVTNVAKCRPPSNRVPTDEEIEICSALYLVEEIQVVNPYCILAVGNAACEGLLGVTGVSSIRGQWHKLDRNQMTWVMPTFHPAYVNYNKGTEIETLFNQDVETFASKYLYIRERHKVGVDGPFEEEAP